MYTDEQMYGLITKPEPEKISRYDMINKPEPEELYHHGIKGMKWGKRRYQNPDGTLTPEGKRRYEDERKSWTRDPEKFKAHYDDLTPEERQYAIQRRRDIKAFADAKPIPENKKPLLSTVAKEVGAGAGMALLAYKGYKWLGGDDGQKLVNFGKKHIKKAWKWATSEPTKSKAAKRAAQKGSTALIRVLRSGGKRGFISFG